MSGRLFGIGIRHLKQIFSHRILFTRHVKFGGDQNLLLRTVPLCLLFFTFRRSSLFSHCSQSIFSDFWKLTFWPHRDWSRAGRAVTREVGHRLQCIFYNAPPPLEVWSWAQRYGPPGFFYLLCRGKIWPLQFRGPEFKILLSQRSQEVFEGGTIAEPRSEVVRIQIPWVGNRRNQQVQVCFKFLLQFFCKPVLSPFGESPGTQNGAPPE